MDAKGAHITNDKLDFIFPFYFTLNDSLIITEAGKGIRKILPQLLNNQFSDYFNIKRPFSMGSNYNSFLEYLQQIFILEINSNKILLKGQFLFLEEQNKIIFLGSPWLSNVSDMEEKNILITDFALHDSTPDMLQVLKSQEIVMNDIKQLVEELNNQKTKLTESENRYKQIVEEANDIIYRSDFNGFFTYINPVAKRLLKMTEEDIIGKHFSQLIHEDYRSEAVSFYKKHFSNKSPITYYQFPIVNSQNEIIWLEQNVNAIIENGKIAGFHAVARDITIRKKAEQDLIKAKEIAEHSQKVKEQFLANMSHEIRTPMNAILGMTNILLENKFTQEQKECIDAIKLSSENLLTIINDILDFSKIESGKITFEKTSFSLKETLDGIIQTLHFTAEKKNIRFYYAIDNTIPEYLIGDAMRLRQILLNLAGNAIKFTEQGEVKIEVQTASVENNIYNLKYSVSDTGIGIPSNKIEHIFESFTQVSSETTRKFGGTGLGLTIAKQLVELQGGKIAVDSELNNGSCFHFNLSFEKSTQQQNQTTDSTASNNNSLEDVKILLVEDNAMNQLLAKKIFEKWQCIYDIADNGLIAIDKLSKNTYDIILMDMQMPEMDGYETTQYIRNKLSGATSQIPIIAMTAHAMVGEEKKCLELGMNDYISKPFNQQNLLEKIKKLISKEEKNHQTEEQIQYKSVKATYTDLDYLKTLAEGNNEFMIQMIEIFLEQSAELLEKIRDSSFKKEWNQVKAIAHKMRPGNEMMGIKSCSELLLNIEIHATQQKNLEHIEEQVQKVVDIYKMAIKELKQELIKLSKYAA